MQLSLASLENAKLCTYVLNIGFPSTIHQTFSQQLGVLADFKTGMNCSGD